MEVTHVYIECTLMFAVRLECHIYLFVFLFALQIPGELLGIGQHIIKYVAIDDDDLSAQCEFTISVKGMRFAHLPTP